MTYYSGEIDTTNDGTVSDIMSIGQGETVITLNVKLKTGTHNNSRTMLQHSPDGGKTWFDSLHSTNGTGSVTMTIATLAVRVCVLKGEKSPATALYFVTAK